MAQVVDVHPNDPLSAALFDGVLVVFSGNDQVRFHGLPLERATRICDAINQD